MSLSTAATVVGIFEDQEQARQAIAALKQAGFRNEDIRVAAREWSAKLEGVRVDEQHTAEHGAVAGALVGGGLGVAAGLVGTVLAPPVAPALAAAAALGALGGGLAGAGAGVFAGPFIALGLSEHEAHRHARHVEQGRTVLLVHAPERHDEASDIMVAHGAYDESMNASP